MREFETGVRRDYDAIAEDYVVQIGDWLADRSSDRAVLAAFAELVRTGGGGPVLDLGCGPGYTTARLQELGLEVSGVDLSPRMVALVHRLHPGVDAAVGSLLEIDRPDASLAGAACIYSLIHVPPPARPAALAELARVVRPGGQLLLTFQVGDAPRHHDEAWGHAVDLDFWRLDPETVTEQLAAAGFEVHGRVVRDPGPDEPTPQGFLLARRTHPGNPLPG